MFLSQDAAGSGCGWVGEATGVAVLHYALLLPPEQLCLERVRDRVGHGFTDFDAASRAFRTWRGDVSWLVTCSVSAGVAGVDVEQLEEPGLEGWGSGDVGGVGVGGRHQAELG